MSSPFSLYELGYDMKCTASLLSFVWCSATPWTPVRQVPLSFTISWSLLRFMFIELVTLSNYLIFCHPLILLTSIFPSTRVFSSELGLHIRLQSIGASASASVLLMNIQGWFPIGLTTLIIVLSKGISKSLLQHHNLKASILQPSAFFMVQLSNPYMTTGKMIAMTIWIFVSEVVPLLLNMLCRFVIPFSPRSKHILISQLQSPSTVILSPRK